MSLNEILSSSSGSDLQQSEGVSSLYLAKAHADAMTQRLITAAYLRANTCRASHGLSTEVITSGQTRRRTYHSDTNV